MPEWSNLTPVQNKNRVRVTHGNRGADFDQLVTMPESNIKDQRLGVIFLPKIGKDDS
jgi:hypothetical protein